MATVFLTFDDGPLGGTDDVIAALNAQQVKGTLFMVGNHVSTQWRRDRLEDAHNSCFIQVANHSTTHADNEYRNYYSNPREVLRGFNTATSTLRISTRPVDARLPGRNTWRVGSIVQTASDSGPAADQLMANGFRIFGWDIEWRMDNAQPAQIQGTIARVIQGCQTKRPGKVILLMHDVMFRMSTGGRFRLDQLIRLLKDDGHSFEWVANYAR